MLPVGGPHPVRRYIPIRVCFYVIVSKVKFNLLLFYINIYFEDAINHFAQYAIHVFALYRSPIRL